MKILFVKLSALGDAFDTSPIPESLNYSHNIHIAVSPQSSIALARNPAIDKYFVFDLLGLKSVSKWSSLLLTTWKLFVENILDPYDLVYVFHCDPRISALLGLIGIKRVYRFSHSTQSKYVQKYRHNINRTIQEIQLLRRSGLSVRTPKALSFFPEESSYSNRLLFQLTPKASYISIVVGGGNSVANANTRSLQPAFVADLVRRYSKEYTFILLGKGDDDSKRERNIIEELSTNQDAFHNVISLVNQSSLSEVFQIFARSKAIITGDTGLSKVAAASGSPVLIIFGPTTSSLASPLGDNVTSFHYPSHCISCYSPSDGKASQMYSCPDADCMPRSADSLDFFFSTLKQ